MSREDTLNARVGVLAKASVQYKEAMSQKQGSPGKGSQFPIHLFSSRHHTVIPWYHRELVQDLPCLSYSKVYGCSSTLYKKKS